MSKFSKIATLGYNAINNDIRDFKKWIKEEISTRECYEKFCTNNHYPIRDGYDEQEFIEYLRSLGWDRNQYKLENGIYNANQPVR